MVVIARGGCLGGGCLGGGCLLTPHPPSSATAFGLHPLVSNGQLLAYP